MIGRRLAAAAAILGAVGFAAAPQPAQANVSPGWAAAIGVGAFALGTAVANPYYGYPAGYYAPPPAYYYPPPAPYYPAAPYPYRSCWSPYYRTYVAC
jgi:hypothetical protein